MKVFVQINDRGTITLPKVIRESFPGLDMLQVSVENQTIILEPLQTRDDFLEELEMRSQEARAGKTVPLKDALKRLDKHHGV